MSETNKFFKINEKAIRRKYSSLANFRREVGISVGVFDGLKKKKTDIFKAGGESWKAYQKMLDMGFIKLTEDKEG